MKQNLEVDGFEMSVKNFWACLRDQIVHVVVVDVMIDAEAEEHGPLVVALLVALD